MGVLEPGNMFILDCSRRQGGVNRIVMTRDGRTVGVLEEGDALMLLRVHPRIDRRGVVQDMAEWRILAKGQEASITLSRDARDSLRLLSRP